MWGSLLGLALLISLNPILLGFILLVISRPRPVQNLLVYWVGAMLINTPVFVAPLILFHVTPGFASFAENLANSRAESSPGTIQLGPLILAVVLLSIAAVMMVRPRLRERANVSVGGGDGSAAVDESTPPASSPGLLGGVRDLVVKAVAAFQRLYARLTTTWEIGSLWVAFVFGLMYVPSTTLVLLIDTTIVASGAGIGEQIIAATAFVVGLLAALEIVLISCLIAPSKTEVVLRPVHEWARAHSRHIFVVFFALLGIWQLTMGLGLT